MHLLPGQQNRIKLCGCQRPKEHGFFILVLASKTWQHH